MRKGHSARARIVTHFRDDLVGRVLTGSALIGIALASGSCADEELRQLVPHISLCPAIESAPEQCDDVIDVGDLPVEVAAPLQVFIVNRGDGRLSIDAAVLDDESLSLRELPEDVAAKSGRPLVLVSELSVGQLGPGSAELAVLSSDRARSPSTVRLTWVGVPPPQPDILLCDGEGASAPCAVPLDLDFGAVRPTQAASRVVTVKNVGEDPLTIEGARIEGSLDFSFGSSAAGGVIAPGESAPLLVLYSPIGDGDDQGTLIIASDDRDTPAAIVNLRGTGGDDAPPVARCAESVSGGASGVVRVDDLVGIDGSASSDPEGDPLSFQWTLTAPAGASAAIEDRAAQRALFFPDVRGSYQVTLLVRDSLGQASEPCVVIIEATARFAFRARASWASGGDLDLHLVESGSALFSTRDVHYANRAVDGFQLLDDAETGPGSEVIAGDAPASGTWQLWAQLFDDAGLGAVNATVEVILDDTMPASFSATGQLPSSCSLWHVGDVTFPDRTVTLVDATASQCP